MVDETVVDKEFINLAAKWVTIELMARLNKAKLSISESPVSPEGLRELLSLIQDKTISNTIAKHILDVMFETGKSASDILNEEGLNQLTDTKEMEELVKNVLESNNDKVLAYKNGNEKLLNTFVGLVMKASNGKANPSMVNEMIRTALQ